MSRFHQIVGRRHLAAAFIGAGALLIQGCAQPDLARFDDGSDVCNPQRQQLIALRTTDQQEQINSAATGAAIGGIIAAGVVLAAGGDARDAALIGGVGALAGGLAGYSKTYAEQKTRNAQTREQLLSAVNLDADQERATLTRTAVSVQALRDCRNAQIAAIERDIEGGALQRDVALARVEGVQERVAADNLLIGQVLDSADERVAAYVDTTAAASNVDVALLAAERRDAEARRAQTQVASTSRSVLQVDREVEQLRTSEVEAREDQDQRLKAMLVQIG
jgi:hypothetical protein